MTHTLIVCEPYPLPENTGSNIRTMNFVRFFKHHGTVDLVYAEGTKSSEADEDSFRYEYPVIQLGYPTTLRARVGMVINGIPYPIREYESTSKAALLHAVDCNDYHYILVRYAVNTNWLNQLARRHVAKTIVDMDDLVSESLYQTFFYATNRPHKRLLRLLNRYLLKQYERKCARYGASIFCSETDLHKMTPIFSRKNAFVVPNSYPDESFARHDFGDGYPKQNIFLFVGSLFYEPNVTGLMWFVNEVYQHLQAKYPDSKLLIVGRSPIDSVRYLQHRNLNLEICANVPDLRPFYERCRAVVVPILTGGGTRIKILEAALANRPVLSTPRGAEGLDLCNGVHLHLFTSGAEFIEKYEHLSSLSAYRSMVESAREQVLKKYTTGGFNAAMSKVLAYLGSRTA